MSRFFLIALIVASLVGAAANEARAQRDSGAKARGDYRGFWDPSYRRSSGASYQVQPAGPPVEIYQPSAEVLTPSVQSYRSFSYQPTAISTGDTVVVTSDDVRLMRGPNVVGTLPKGQSFKVTGVVNGWLGTVIEVDGQTLNGWVWHANVSRENDAGVAPGSAAMERQQEPVYRRFSYEPLPETTTYPRYRTGRQTWRWENPKGFYRSN